MTISSFKVGDRVVLARPDDADHRHGLKEGMRGTVRRIGAPELMRYLLGDDAGRTLVLVKFDNYNLGTGGGLAGDGTPSHRNIEADQLELEG